EVLGGHSKEYYRGLARTKVKFDSARPEGEEWETIHREWKQFGNLFIPNTPNVEDDREGSASDDLVLEDTPLTKKVLTKPTNQPGERKN
ncbi:hypothetical protein J1N35_011641, partial [Gossypium stocksii]